MADTIPPVITDIPVISLAKNSAKVTGITDEFADSVVKYGINSTAYTETCLDVLFVKEHEITLTELSPDTTYYFVVNSTDQSGNSAESSEYRFKYLYSGEILTMGTFSPTSIANQAGKNKAIFSMLTGLIPPHFNDCLPFSMFTIADINTRLTLGLLTLVTPRSTIRTTRFCLFEVSTNGIKSTHRLSPYPASRIPYTCLGILR